MGQLAHDPFARIINVNWRDPYRIVQISATVTNPNYVLFGEDNTLPPILDPTGYSPAYLESATLHFSYGIASGEIVSGGPEDATISGSEDTFGAADNVTGFYDLEQYELTYSAGDPLPGAAGSLFPTFNDEMTFGISIHDRFFMTGDKVQYPPASNQVLRLAVSSDTVIYSGSFGVAGLSLVDNDAKTWTALGTSGIAGTSHNSILVLMKIQP